MRRLLLALALLLPVVAGAQEATVFPPDQVGAPAFTGGTITSPLLLPDGSLAAPALAFTNDADSFLYRGVSYRTGTGTSVIFSKDGIPRIELTDLGTGDNAYFYTAFGTTAAERLRFQLDAGLTFYAWDTPAAVNETVAGISSGAAYFGGIDASLDSAITLSDGAALGFQGDTLSANITYLYADDPSANRVIRLPNASGTVTLEVDSGALAFDPGSTATATCAAAITDTATGTLTTDVISWTFNADPTSTTGYNPAGDLGYIVAYPTADTVNFKFCNKSGSAIDPGSVTLNWRVDR